MPSPKEITVRFCFTKSDDEEIHRSRFSKDELADLRLCLFLNLVYETGIVGHEGQKIVSIEIIHDGITPLDDDDGNSIEGFYLDVAEKYPLCGSPTPVVRFVFDRPLRKEIFRQCIMGSSYRVHTKSMKKKDETPYQIEDWNGYSSVLSSTESKSLISYLMLEEAYNGKIFHFPFGMPEYGHCIPAMEFATKP